MFLSFILHTLCLYYLLFQITVKHAIGNDLFKIMHESKSQQRIFKNVSLPLNHINTNKIKTVLVVSDS